jgi:hypothetical protein
MSAQFPARSGPGARLEPDAAQLIGAGRRLGVIVTGEACRRSLAVPSKPACVISGVLVAKAAPVLTHSSLPLAIRYSSMNTGTPVRG